MNNFVEHIKDYDLHHMGNIKEIHFGYFLMFKYSNRNKYIFDKIHFVARDRSFHSLDLHINRYNSLMENNIIIYHFDKEEIIKDESNNMIEYEQLYRLY